MTKGRKLRKDTKSHKKISTKKTYQHTTDLKKGHLLLISLFFLSGLCGLMYEVVWTRLLALVFGNSMYAVATVLSVFMLGLALGSFIAGRIINKDSNLRRIYALLEIGIGVYALIFLPLLGLIQHIHSLLFPLTYETVWILTLIRFFLSFLVIIIPTTLMGATIPVLSQLITKSEKTIGRDVGVLYALNTLGATLGTFVSAFIIMPYLGLHWVFYLGAILNIGIGLAVYKVQLAEDHSPLPITKHSQASLFRTKEGLIILLAFGLMGLLSMVYENAWTRALTMVFGTSVYAFATMLTTFLLGLGAGSLLISAFIDKIKRPFKVFALLSAFIGISIFVTTPIIGRLPDFFLNIFAGSEASWQYITFTEFFISFLIMLGPTMASGACFPLASRLVSKNRDFQVGITVADVYALNTFGCILGSVLAGFLLIPKLGTETALLLGGTVNLLLAAFLLLFITYKDKESSSKKFIPSTILAGLAVSGFFLLPSWNPTVMNSGVYTYADSLKSKGNQNIRSSMSSYSLLFYKEGPSANVSVFENEKNERFLRVNGKTDGSTGTDSITQILLGTIPLLYSTDPREVMVIGLGTGMTLSSVLDFEVGKVDCLEISSAVVQAASYFEKHTDNVLKSPKVNLQILDGRTWLKSMDREYKVITSEPSHPWQTGNANLFTQDFFQIAKKRLTKSGVFCQWLPYYRLKPEHLKILISTYHKNFPYVHVWLINTDLLLIGSKSPLQINYKALEKKMSRPSIKNSLKNIDIQKPSDLLSFFYLDTRAVDKFVQNIHTINSDVHPIIEFQAPKILAKKTDTDIFFEILELSFNSQLSLTNCSDKSSVRRERIYSRAKYYQDWQIPQNIYEYMLRNSLP